MINELVTSAESVGVSLVNGDTSVRHARQLLLRSENYDVRSYPTGAALLADPRSRDYACIVIDIGLQGAEGLHLLQRLRAGGWRGKAIILNDGDTDNVVVEEAKLHGDQVFERSIADRLLLRAVTASIEA